MTQDLLREKFVLMEDIYKSLIHSRNSKAKKQSHFSIRVKISEFLSTSGQNIKQNNKNTHSLHTKKTLKQKEGRMIR